MCVGKITGEYAVQTRHALGGLSFVVATVSLVFAMALAAGAFGSGYTAFVAAGLTLASIGGFAFSAYAICSQIKPVDRVSQSGGMPTDSNIYNQ